MYIIFNVYMPCDQFNFIDIYIKVLFEISNYCLINNVTHFVVGGGGGLGLNADFGRRHLSNTIALKKIIADECLILCLHSHVSAIRYT